MSRLGVFGIALLGALVLLPGAGAAVSVTYTITSGTAGDNGWFKSDVSVSIQTPGASDTNCPAAKTFRASSDALDCTATDGTGTVNFHLQFKIDKDAPTVTGASPDRQPNGNGWYNAPVNVTFAGTDPTSGIASCQTVTYSGGDSGSASVSGTCRDVAGNISAPFTFALKYDATAPSVSASPSRDADAGGWYNHPVSVAFSGSDATSGIDSCTTGSYGGPDSGSASVSGTCTDKAGNTATGSFALQYDSTPPTVSLALTRPPDSNGWYNHPVAATATGSDSGSGLDSCSADSYSGPMSENATLTGTCKDHAGNSASSSITFKYDSTPPQMSQVVAAPGNQTVTLHWTIQPGTSVTVTRDAATKTGTNKVVYKGSGEAYTDTKLTNGRRYHYSLDAVDQAGNTATAAAAATPVALSTTSKALKKPPRLTWARVRKASYYNLQLFHEGKKILSIWPLGTSLKLPSSWTFEGKKHRLVPGLYRWYIWPGFGPRKNSKYGQLLGGSTFVMAG